MFIINEEVKQALKNNIPVVALESTIISHGMPYPKNVETALLVEKMIRDNGAIPATIGIIDGNPIIGMNPEQIEQFGKRKAYGWRYVPSNRGRNCIGRIISFVP